MKNLTSVEVPSPCFRISPSDRIMVLGSCFASNIGQRLKEEGYKVCCNPFGTIFNPASIRSSLDRLEEPTPFDEDECVQMGAGSNLWGSFSHYTRFARETRSEFLENANRTLEENAAFYRDSKIIIITFGTSWVFRHVTTPETDALLAKLFPGRGRIVSNCLKRPAREFLREFLVPGDIVAMFPPDFAAGRKVIFTVSPIRHLSDGAHGNQISKAGLLMACDRIVASNPDFVYFPSYEIMLDELRDYSWYAQDLVHPSDEAVRYILSRFRTAYL